jgi:hypothetical protein
LTRSPSSSPIDAISLAPILIWFLIQLAALVLAAFRVPLAAEYPQPAEFHAVQILLVAQFAWVTMLFPSLLRTWMMTLIVICAGWTMLIMAGALSAWAIADVLPLGTFLSLWIVSLGLMRAALPWNWQMIASAIASAYVIGGPLVWYLRSDFGTSLPVETSVGFGPLWLCLATPRNLPSTAWWSEVGIAVIAASIAPARNFARFTRRPRA